MTIALLTKSAIYDLLLEIYEKDKERSAGLVFDHICKICYNDKVIAEVTNKICWELSEKGGVLNQSTYT